MFSRKDLLSPVVPPGYHAQQAGHHWLREVDYDGRAGNHIVLQWQPQARAWCHSDQYSRGQAIDTTGWMYVAPCPLPVLTEEKPPVEVIAWAWRCEGMKGWALGNLKPTPDNCHQFHERKYDVRALVLEDPDADGERELSAGHLVAGELFLVQLDPDHAVVDRGEEAKKHAVRIYRACHAFSFDLKAKDYMARMHPAMASDISYLGREYLGGLLREMLRTGWIEEINPVTKITSAGKVMRWRDHFDDPSHYPRKP